MSNWQYIGLMRKEFGEEWLLKTQFFKTERKDQDERFNFKHNFYYLC